ncbi:lysosomal alpha-glucosidase, partial [Aplysia californica]|uniref:Lysosomal alpha-glucosidase n=1 Tax=Aplysia californica TaxID=6500 RepID=A0ABM1A0U5_APLCA
MHISIIHILEFGLFGIPMTGADICGFWLQTSSELCVRWHQLGAFYPFARNHNSKYVQWDRFVEDTGPAPVLTEDQDPAAFGQQFVDLVKPAMMTRQKLLPYMYTLFYRAHVMGDTVARPLFFEFPEDEKTLTIDRQFMLGPALLISPILTQGATTVDAYVPQGRWFDYITGEEVQSSGQQLSLETP